MRLAHPLNSPLIEPLEARILLSADPAAALASAPLAASPAQAETARAELAGSLQGTVREENGPGVGADLFPPIEALDLLEPGSEGSREDKPCDSSVGRNGAALHGAEPGGGPRVLSLTATGFQDWAGLSWTTDSPASAEVRYGEAAGSHPLAAGLSEFTLEHRLRLDGLRPGVTYHARIASADSQGRITQTAEFTFTTSTARRTALVCGDPVALTAREQAVLERLEAQPALEVTRVAAAGATHEGLAQFEWVVLSDFARGPPAAEVRAMVEGWSGVVLVADSGKALGGTWNASSTSAYRELEAVATDAILADYGVGARFLVQASGTAYGVDGLAGWTPLASGVRGGTIERHTMLTRGEDCVFSYDPAQLTGEGAVLLTKLARRMAQATEPAVTIPAGHVALIVRDYVDPAVRTSQETGLAAALGAHGYPVTYVTQGQRSFADTSRAAFVAMTHDVGVPLEGFLGGLMSRGTGVALLYDAGAAWGGDWGTGSSAPYLVLTVDAQAGFLAPYDVGAAFPAQEGGSAAYVNPLPGWTALGHSYHAVGLSALYRERGAILGYDPARLTGEGEAVFAAMGRWLVGDSAWRLTVPAGQVALVSTDYERADVLTPVEQNVRDRLTALGYGVTAIPQSERFFTDYRQAAFVVAAGHVGFPLAAFWNGLADQGIGVALLGEAGRGLGGGWLTGASGPYLTLTVDAATACLADYDPGSVFGVQASGPSWSIGADPVVGWEKIGHSYFVKSATVLARDRGVVFGYNPITLTGEGEVVFEKLVRHLTGNVTARLTIPAGAAALVVRDYQAGQVLTPSEQALRDRLVAAGYEVRLVPYGLRSLTDFHQAALVAFVEYGGFTAKRFVEGLVDDQVRVLLVHEAGRMLGGSWNQRSDAASRRLVVGSSMAFLSAYPVATTLEAQSAGSAWYALSASALEGWSTLGSSYHALTASALVRQAGGGAGAVLSYDPQYYSNDGAAVLTHALAWLRKEVAADLGPDRTLPRQVASTFDASGSWAARPIAAYEWDLDGDGEYDDATGTAASRSWETVGTYTVGLRVRDTAGATATDELTVRIVPNVDLAIERIERVPLAYQDGDAVTFTVVLRNAGLDPLTDDFAVDYRIDGNHQTTVWVRDTIPAGGTAQAVWRWTAQAGKAALAVTADRAGRVIETQEDNNSLRHTLAAVERADLVVSALTWTPEGFADGENLVLIARVTNLGTGGTSSTFAVGFDVNGKYLGRQIVAGLGAGASASVQQVWKAQPGTCVVRARVDPTGVVSELDEANNSRSITLPTVADVTPPQIAAFTPAEQSVVGPSVVLAATANDVSGVASVRYEVSRDGVTWALVAEGAATTAVWTTTGLVEGPWRIRLTAIDRAGNPATLVRQVTLDTTPPPAPTGLVAQAAELVIRLAWTAPTVQDLSHFAVYRSTRPDAGYALLAERVDLETYADTSAVPGQPFYYVVRAVDRAGNVGPASVVATGAALPDVTVPVLASFTPEDGTRSRGLTRLSVGAEDQGGIASVTFDRSTDGQVWTAIKTGTMRAVDWDTRTVADGNWQVRVTVRDAAGNAASLTRTLVVDNSAPAAPRLTATGIQGGVRLEWTTGGESDLRGSSVFRSSKPGGPYQAIPILPLGNACEDRGETPGVTWYYVVVAKDDLGNASARSNEAAAAALADTTAPAHLTLSVPADTVLHREVVFVGHAQDNLGVTLYRLEYSVEGAAWLPIAQAADGRLRWDTRTVGDGAYRVRLIARDAAGNEATLEQPYTVVNSPIPAPAHLRSQVGEWSASVGWDPAQDDRLRVYRLYRRAGAGAFELRAETTSTVWVDRLLDPAFAYEYAVAAVDGWGVEGTRSEALAVQPLQQVSVPTGLTLTPPAGTRFASALELTATAKDRVGIVRFTFEYSRDGTTWFAAGTDNAPEESRLVGWTGRVIWDTSALEPGPVQVRVLAVNRGGVSAALKFDYVCDRTAPGVPGLLEVTNPRSGGRLELSWAAPADTDLLGYRMYRTTASGGPYLPVGGVLADRTYADTGLADGTAYFYVVKAVDRAGNESAFSAEAAGVPTAETDLRVARLGTDPVAPPLQQESPLIARIENLGPAPATGLVVFYWQSGDLRELLGQVRLTEPVPAGGGADVRLTHLPLDAGWQTYIAEVVEVSPVDLVPGNNQLAAPIRVNQIPVAPVLPAVEVAWGEARVFNGSGAQDADGSVRAWRWDFGDGGSADLEVATHAFRDLGTFNVTLTVTDNDGATGHSTFTVTVHESRPDLAIQDLNWNPQDPAEGQVVAITARIGNQGVGATAMGFFATFYIDGQYAGYERIDEHLAPGGTTEASFAWLALPGIHTVEVRADDIQDNLAEIDETNNRAFAAMTTQQVFFPALTVGGLAVSPATAELSSQASIRLEARVANEGTAAAEAVWVALFLDGEYEGRTQVARLAAGGEATVTFDVDPRFGGATATVMVDGPTSAVVEADETDNTANVQLPSYRIVHPDLVVTALDWTPKELELAHGASLTFTATVANEGATDVLRPYAVGFYVDDELVDTREGSPLPAGTDATFTARWAVKPGAHTVRVVVDEAAGIAEASETNNELGAVTGTLDVFYADLTVGDVRWLPLPAEISHGDTLTVLVDVSNNSLVSTYGPFLVSLFVDDRAVDGLEVPVLSGLQTTPVPLSWKVNVVGRHDIRVVVDARNVIREANEANNTYTLSTSIADSFVFRFNVDGEDPTRASLPPMYGSRETMHLGATISLATGRQLTGDEAEAYVTVRFGGAPVIDHQRMAYDTLKRTFTYAVPFPSFGTGNYVVEVTATDGVIARTVAFPVIVIEEVVFTLQTDRQVYQRGSPVQFSGQAVSLSGKPLANEKIELLIAKGEFPDQDASHLFVAAMMNELMKGVYGVESGVRVEVAGAVTDREGRFGLTWTPRWDDGGYFTANAVLVSSRVVGTMGKCQFEILGLSVDPADLTVAVGKNTVYQRDVTFTNIGDNVLTGFKVELLDLAPDPRVILTMDASRVPSSLHPGARVTVALRWQIAEDAPGTAGCLLTGTSTAGAMVTSTIALQLHPAVPVLRFEPGDLGLALHPGETRTVPVTVVNEGLGTMRSMTPVGPAILPWVTVGGLSATELAPGQRAVFELTVSPPSECVLGTYADRVGIRNGTAAYLPLQVELTSADRGSVTLVVFNDAGETVPGADIRLVSRAPHLALAYTGEQYQYFPQHQLTTDAEGRATLVDAEIGEYEFAILAPAHERLSGVLRVQPFREAEILTFELSLVPVLYEWKVTPTSITDEYDIVLNLTFAARIPTPTLAFVPPWATVPQQVDAGYTDWFTVINPCAVELHDVRVNVEHAPGITLVGDGYLGTLPPESSVVVQFRVAPGDYRYLAQRAGTAEAAFRLRGTYVEFDSRTLLARETGLGVGGGGVTLELRSPSERKVTVWVQKEPFEVALPAASGEGDSGPELPPPIDAGLGEEEQGVMEVVTLQIPQKAALEREAFDCTLRLTNGYARQAMDGLNITVRVEDAGGRDVTSRFHVIGPEVTGLGAIDGTDRLEPLASVEAAWQLIPGEGLGGTHADGQKYYIRAFWNYFVNGRLVQTQTEAAEVTIHPQPKLLLHYFIAQDVRAYQPFKLGLVVENIGDGVARNLRIESGQPEILENESGLLIDFNIVAVSFGGSQGETFKLVLGDVQPHSQVSGYWLLNCNLDGSFKDFRAELTHRLYKGVELNPLIAGVDTQIIVMDSVILDPAKPDETYSLIDQDRDGFPDYFINLATGLHLPLTVPARVTVTQPATPENKTLRLSVPQTSGYIVVITPDQHPDWNVTRVQREIPGQEPFVLGIENCWKQRGNVYFIDEGGGDYLVDYRSGLVVEKVEYSPRAVFEATPADYTPIFFETGIKPDLNDITYLRARVFNRGVAFESARIDFFDVNAAGQETLIASATAEAHPFWYSGHPGKDFGFVFAPIVAWTPTTAGARTVVARLATDSAKPEGRVTVAVNATPVAFAGHDLTGTVGVPVQFDASASRDPDGFIRSYAWDFGEFDAYSFQDDEGVWYWIQEGSIWGSGQTASYAYSKPGTFHVTLHVTDDNGGVGADTILVTIRETRPDLVIEQLTLDPPRPPEGQLVTVTARLANRGVAPATAPFFVSLYVDDRFHATVKVDATLAPGQTREIPFAWSATLGNHRLKAVADDIEDRVVESAETNNATSALVYPEQVNFPDLLVEGLAWSESGSPVAVVGWDQTTTLRARIANRGVAAAGAFSVSFYLDGAFLSRSTVPGLSAQEGNNTVEVGVPWVPTAGNHLLSVLADGPIRHVLETNEDNNTAALELPPVQIAYANLQVAAIEYTPDSGRVPDTGSLQIRARIQNAGEQAVYTPFAVEVYVDGRLRGRPAIASLGPGASEWVTVDWPAAAGQRDLRVVVDPDGRVVEGNEFDNTSELLDVPVTVLYPELVVQDVRSSPRSPQYGEPVEFRITVSNQGEAPTQGPFVTALRIAHEEPILVTHAEPLLPGASVVLTASWRALANTAQPIAVEAEVDVASLAESNEANNTATTSLELRHGYVLAPSSQYAAYLAGTEVVLRATVSRSDVPATPLGPAAGVGVAFQLLDAEGRRVAAGPMVYNSVAQFWMSTVPATRVDPGTYRALITAAGALGTFTEEAAFSVIEDVTLTLSAHRPTYGAQENVLLRGQVQTTGGVPVPSLPVTLRLSGGAERELTAVTRANGEFSVIWPPGGLGGDYTATAAVELSGLTRTATATFEVQGLAITPFPAAIQLPQGGRTTLEFTIRNAGTDPQTLVTVALTGVPDLPGLTVTTDTPAAFDLRRQGETRTVRLTLATTLDTPEGRVGFQLTVDSAQATPTRAPVRLTVVVAAPAYEVTSLDNPSDPLSIQMAMYAGTRLSRTLRIANVGSADMTGLTLSSPHLPWLSVGTGNLPDRLTPGQSGSVTVYFQPPTTLAKGAYVDELVLASNAGPVSLRVAVEVTTATTGSLALLVVNPQGQPLPGVRATLRYLQPLGVLMEQLDEADAPAVPGTNYLATTDARGRIALADLPVGSYYVAFEAEFHAPLTSTLDVKPTWDVPQSLTFILPERPWRFRWDYADVRDWTIEELKSGRSMLDDAAANPVCVSSYNPAYTQAAIQIDQPGQEILLDGSSLAAVVPLRLVLRNASADRALVNLAVRAEGLPEGALLLGGAGTRGAWLGELGPRETVTLAFGLAGTAFKPGPTPAVVRGSLVIEGEVVDAAGNVQRVNHVHYLQVVVPPASPDGWGQAPGLRDALSRQIRIQGALTGEQVLVSVPFYEYLRSQIHYSPSPLPPLPDAQPSCWVTLELSQSTGVEGEPITATVEIHNRSDTDPLENLDVSLVTFTDPFEDRDEGPTSTGTIGGLVPVDPLDGGGPAFLRRGVVEATIFFEQELEDPVVPDAIPPGETVAIKFKLTPKKGTSTITEDPLRVYTRVRFRTTITEEEIVTGDTPLTVQPVPKLYVGYGIVPTGEPGQNWYDLTIRVTNIGGTEDHPTTAHDVRVVTNGTREGVVILGPDSVDLGDIVSGQTAVGHLTVRAVDQSEIVASIIPTVEVAGGTPGVRWRPFGAEVDHGGKTLDDLRSKLEEIQELLLGDGTDDNPGKLESDRNIVANALYETIWLSHESAGLKGLLDFTDYVNQSVRHIMGTFSKVREYADMARKWTETLLDEDALWDKVKDVLAEETKKFLVGYTESLLVSDMETDRADLQKMVADLQQQLGDAEAELAVVSARDEVLEAFLAGLDDQTYKDALVADITRAEAGLAGESAGLYAGQAALYAATRPDVALLFEELAGLVAQDPLGEFDATRLEAAVVAVRDRFQDEADTVAARRATLEATVEQLTQNIASLERYLEELEQAIEERKSDFQKLISDIEEVIENSDRVVEWLAEKVEGAIEEVEHSLSEAAEETLKDLLGWNTLVDKVGQSVETFKEAVNETVETFVAAPYAERQAELERLIGELELEQSAKTADVAILRTEIGLLQLRAGALEGIRVQAPADPLAAGQLSALRSAIAALEAAVAERNGRIGTILAQLADLRAEQQTIRTQIEDELAAINKLKELSLEGAQLIQDIREEEETSGKVLKGVEWMVSTVSKAWDEFYASHQNEVQQHLYNLQKSRMPNLGHGGITARDVMEQGAKLTGVIELFQEAVAITMWDIGASLPDSPAFQNLLRVAANARSMNYERAMTYLESFWNLACQPRLVNEQDLYEKFYLELLIGEEERTEARHDIVQDWPADESLDDAQDAIRQDLEDALAYLSSLGAEPPAYFPVGTLYEYLEMLARRIEDTTYTWGVPGRHMMPMVWFTFGVTDEPTERTFGTISYPLGSLYDPMHELVVAEAQGWDTVADMWRMWQLKFAVGLMGNAGEALAASPVGQMLTTPFQILDPLVNSYAQLIVDRNAFVRRVMTEQLGLLFVLNSGEIMATRRLALDLENSFKWLSEHPIVDPPMPVRLDSVQTPDIVLAEGQYHGEQSGAVTVRNNAAFAVQTTAEIWISYRDQQLAVFRSAPLELGAGQTAVLPFDYRMIRSLTAGLEGFDVLAYLYVVDPATLNEELVGPAYSHFYVGTPDDLALLHRQEFRQLLVGTTGTAGARETELAIAPDTHALTFHFLRSEGADLRLHLRDNLGRHVGWTDDGRLEAAIPGATVTALSEAHFLVEFSKPATGTLRVAVEDRGSPEGSGFTVTALATPSLPALLSPLADTLIVSGPGPVLTLNVPVLECTGQRAVTGLQVRLTSAPADDQGHVLPASAFTFTPGSGTIPAGGDVDIGIRIQVPAGLADGVYRGVITVAGTDSVSGQPLETDVELTVVLDTVAPAAPVLEAITGPVTASAVQVTGRGLAGTTLEFHLDDPTTPVGYLAVGEDGTFSAAIPVAAGTHRVWVVAQDRAGNRSASSNVIQFVSTADVIAPTSRVVTAPVPGQVQKSRVAIVAADDQGRVEETWVAYGESLHWTRYTEPFEVDRTVEQSIWHYAVDAAGNAEAYQQTVLPALPSTPPPPVIARGPAWLPANYDPRPAPPVARGIDVLPTDRPAPRATAASTSTAPTLTPASPPLLATAAASPAWILGSQSTTPRGIESARAVPPSLASLILRATWGRDPKLSSFDRASADEATTMRPVPAQADPGHRRPASGTITVSNLDA